MLLRRPWDEKAKRAEGAALMATAPRSWAATEDNTPLNEPTGVRAALAITIELMVISLSCSDENLRKPCRSLQRLSNAPNAWIFDMQSV